MNKALIGSTLATTLMLSSQHALAEPTAYVGLQYNLYTVSATGMDELEPDGASLKLGGSINDNFQLEGRFGRSLSDDNGSNAAIKVDEYIGFYLKGGMDFADMVFPYLILGYTKLDLEYYGSPTDQTESDLSYGVGADLHFDQFMVGIEWIMLQDKSQVEVENLNLSAAWRF